MNEQMPQVTDEQLIASYINLRNKIDAIKQVHKAELQKYVNAMEQIEAWVHKLLLQRDAQSMKSESGTAFFHTLTSAKVDDKDAFLTFCYSKWEEWGKSMLTKHVSKDALNEYIERSTNEQFPEGQLPPGVKVDRIKVVQFRTSN